MSIEKAMGLGERLAAAEALVPGWGLRHRLLGELTSLDGVFRAARAGTVQDRDEVLRDLARLANKDGGDCEEAAACLAEAGIAVRAGLHCAPMAHRSGGTLETGPVRVSFSAFNTSAEVRQFLQVCRTAFLPG